MTFFKTKTFIGVSAIVLVVILLSIFKFGNGKHEFYEVVEQDFTRTVVVSGKVEPSQEIDLAFEVSGTVASVSVRVGDRVKRGQVLASLDSSEISSEINQISSDLQSEQAKLLGLTNGLENSNDLNLKKEELLNVIKKSYVIADDVLRNKIDTFIDEPESRFPEFSIALRDYFIREDINSGRYDIGKSFITWNSSLNNLNVENVNSSAAQESITYLKELESFLVKISEGTSQYVANTGVTQSQIDGYITSISQARNTVAAAIVEVNQANEGFVSVQNDIPVQQAAVQSAQSALAKTQSKANKYSIRAPFDGVITVRDIDPGEVSEVGRVVISMIGESGLEIETFIPEVRIAGVDVDDNAAVKLDAFGEDEIFRAIVSHVDPSGTEKDGITTYRTILNFLSGSDEIRPGMTAEIEIEKERINSVLMIPAHLVKEDSTGRYVETLRGDIVRQEVVLGKKDEKGSVIVESGLQIGDLIVLPKN